MRTVAAIVLLWLLLLAAAYDAVLAAGWISIGLVPGAGAPGQTAAVVLGLLGIAGAIALLAVAPTRLSMLLVPAGALVVVARFFTFDPYYAPTLRRFSDGGAVPPWWVAALAAGACVCALSRRLAPLGVLVLVLCAGTLLAQGTGH